MSFTWLYCISFIFCVYGYSQYRALKRRIAEAEATGFSYVIAPIYFQSIPWIILQEALLPLLLKLPVAWTESWLPLSLFYRTWHCGYEPFHRAGRDTFLVVSPGGNVLWTCEPEVITQVLGRHKDFPKPVDMLGMLNLYGPTVTASEGEENRLYRKIAAPSFNETTHSLVWSEGATQAAKIVARWQERHGLVPDIGEDSNRFALHVLSKVFFDRELSWDGKEEVPGNHKLSYSDAIDAAFRLNNVLFFIPRPVINNSPLQIHKQAKLAYSEFKKYLEEIRDTTASQLVQRPKRGEGSLVENFVMAGTPGLQDEVASGIPPDAVLGNVFIFIVDGWLCRGTDERNHASTLTVKGQQYMLPNGTLIMINTSALHRSPEYWPHPDKDSLPGEGPPYPLSSFHPERWISAKGQAKNDGHFFHPPAGAYIPFGEGFRACMGSRFAKVEFCAAMANIFRHYSVELANGYSEQSLKDAAEKLSTDVGFGMGLKMNKPVALKFVKREG